MSLVVKAVQEIRRLNQRQFSMGVIIILSLLNGLAIEKVEMYLTMMYNYE